jgi:septum formation protein
MTNITLASASGIRKKILQDFGFVVKVLPANIDEQLVRDSLIKEDADSFHVSRALAELKAKKISTQSPDELVLGADQVLDCEGKIYDKPKDLENAKKLLLVLNNRKHSLFSSICLYKNGTNNWIHTERSDLTMLHHTENFFDDYLNKLGLDTIQRYGVYQIEGIGRQLFHKIEGDEYAVMGMPIKALIDYLILNEK